MKKLKGFNSTRALFELANGNNDFDNIIAIADWVNGRYDCSDFDMNILLRIMYQFDNRLDSAAKEHLRKVILSYKYWIDEPGIDSMCYWSENHQILFATAEYLAGQLYPGEIFINSGLTGLEHMNKARERILKWLTLRWKFGFSEWYSNVYYAEDIAPLCNLADFCTDSELCKKSMIILDVLLLDMALQNYKGVFGGTKGRTYEIHKKSPRKESTRIVTNSLWGDTEDENPRYSLAAFLFLSSKYKVPEVILNIGNDRSSVEIKASAGLNIKELGTKKFEKGSIEEAVYCWGVDAYLYPGSICDSLRIIDQYKLYGNMFLKDLKALDKYIFKSTNILPAALKVLKPPYSEAALKRVNTYLYKNNYYSLSTAQGYNPGQKGYEQHIWQATLSDDITVFTTHPAISLKEHNNNPKQKPNYWVGSGRLPYSVQYRNVVLSLYILPFLSGMGERKHLHYTHAYFPRDKFDLVTHEGRYVFGKYKDAFIALIGQNFIESNPEAPDDLLQKGRQTAWVCEVGTAEESGTFREFIKSIKSADVAFGKGSISYQQKGLNMRLKYKDGLYINGKKINIEYRRLESPYGNIEKKPGSFKVEFSNKSLLLDFEKQKRDENIFG